MGRNQGAIYIGESLNGLCDYHTLSRKGCDSLGSAMPSGTYIVRLETDTSVEARKVMLIR